MSTFVLIGDSQAVGLLPHIVERMYARGYVMQGSAGHVGWSTSSFVGSREAEALSRLNPDVVLVVLGGNDTAGTTLPMLITALVGQIRRYSSPHVVWIGPAHSSVPDIERRKRAVRAVQKTILPPLGVEWHDALPMTVDLSHASDGVHFTQTSLARWAARIDAVLGTNENSARWFGGLAVLGTLGAVAGLVWWARR